MNYLCPTKSLYLSLFPAIPSDIVFTVRPRDAVDDHNVRRRGSRPRTCDGEGSYSVPDADCKGSNKSFRYASPSHSGYKSARHAMACAPARGRIPWLGTNCVVLGLKESARLVLPLQVQRVFTQGLADGKLQY